MLKSMCLPAAPTFSRPKVHTPHKTAEQKDDALRLFQVLVGFGVFNNLQHIFEIGYSQAVNTNLAALRECLRYNFPRTSAQMLLPIAHDGGQCSKGADPSLCWHLDER